MMNEKLKLQMFGIWENFIIDKNERISLINNFEFLHPGRFPENNNFWICFSFVKTKENHQIKITLQEPSKNEKEIGLHDIPTQEGRVHTYFHYVDLKINAVGVYIFRGYVDDELLGECQFEVMKPKNHRAFLK